MGPSYDSNSIESGIDRVSVIKPPFDKNGIDTINKETLELSKNRNLIKDKWNNALAESTKIGIETEVPKDRKIPAFTFINIGKILLILSFQSTLISVCAQTLAKLPVQSKSGLLTLVIMFLSTIILFFDYICDSKINCQCKSDKSDKEFCKMYFKNIKRYWYY